MKHFVIILGFILFIVFSILIIRFYNLSIKSLNNMSKTKNHYHDQIEAGLRQGGKKKQENDSYVIILIAAIVIFFVCIVLFINGLYGTLK